MESTDDPRRALAFRLVGSHLWRDVLDLVLLPDYRRASQVYDSAKDDHRFYQAYKLAIQQMIEWPFQLTEQESPLAPLHAPARRRRVTPPQEAAPAPVVPLPRRQGVLA